MFNVVIDPGFYPGRDGKLRAVPYRNPVLVNTLERAREIVRELFPHAVFSARWTVLCTRPERGEDPETWVTPEVQLPEGCGYWWQASIQVFPNSSWMELDQRRDRECGLIYNETNEPPEPGAKLFYGSRQLLDV